MQFIGVSTNRCKSECLCNVFQAEDKPIYCALRFPSIVHSRDVQNIYKVLIPSSCRSSSHETRCVCSYHFEALTQGCMTAKLAAWQRCIKTDKIPDKTQIPVRRGWWRGFRCDVWRWTLGNKGQQNAEIFPQACHLRWSRTPCQTSARTESDH